MHLQDDVIEEIRTSNDIVAVISEYIKLEKKGKNYFGLCPFHREKTPSFCVVPGEQFYYCFGCGKGGNVFQFVMSIENLDFIDSVKLLADRAGIIIPEEGRNFSEKEVLKKKIYELNKKSALFFFEKINKKEGKKAKYYLEKRGIIENTSRKFGIGYSENKKDLLYNHLLSLGYKEDEILKSGLIIKKENGKVFDRFRDRIMFPIFDIMDRIIGFGGRVLDDSLPKYMNSPETLVYNKRKNLYALNFARKAGSKKSIIVVEGYMDVIALHQNGIFNVVSSLGTSLTEEQGRLLKKYAQDIIISFDSDTAGQAATIRGLDLLTDMGCNVKVLILPENKDPDDYIRENGRKEFLKLIDNSVSLIDYKADRLRKSIDTDTFDGKVEFLNEMAKILSKVENDLEREMHIKKFASDYNISFDSLYSEVLKKIRPKTTYKRIISGNLNRSESIHKRKNISKDNRIIYFERLLLSLLTYENRLFEHIKGKIKVDDFIDENNVRIAEFVFDRIGSKKGLVPAELLNFIDEDIVGEFSKIIINKSNFDGVIFETADDILKRLEKHKLRMREEKINEILKSESKGNTLSQGEIKNLLKELKEITEILKNK